MSIILLIAEFYYIGFINLIFQYYPIGTILYHVIYYYDLITKLLVF